MKPADNASYFVRFRGRVSGPFTLERLRTMAYAGQVSPLHEVSTDRAAWTPATAIPGLLPEAIEPAPVRAAIESPAPPPRDDVRPADKWYYMDADGNRSGPVSARQLLDLADDGEIDGRTEVWSKGMRDWVPFADAGLGRPARRRSPEPPMRTAARPARRGGFGLLIGIAVAVVVLVVAGTAVTLVLVLRKPLSSSGPELAAGAGVINLTDKSESEKTRLFESAVCFVVPGQVVTTRDGAVLEGFMLPREVQPNGNIQFSGGYGTGFVISPDGHVLTNRHVIRECSNYGKSDTLGAYRRALGLKDVRPQIWLFFGMGDKQPASLEYESPDYDFAILRLDAPRPNYFALCDTPPESIPLLEGVKALGFPGKDTETVDVNGRIGEIVRSEEAKQSHFLYQAVERAFPEERFQLSKRDGSLTKRAELKRMSVGERESYVIRHNAQVYHGNSGGPLVARDGTVVGMNTWGTQKEDIGIGFALTFPQIRKELDRRVPGIVWRSHPE